MPLPLPAESDTGVPLLMVSGLYPAYHAHEYSTVQASEALMKSQPSSLFHQARQPWKTLPVSPARLGWQPKPSALCPSPFEVMVSSFSCESQFRKVLFPPRAMKNPGPMLWCAFSCSNLLLLPPFTYRHHDSWLSMFSCSTPFSSRPFRYSQSASTRTPVWRQLYLLVSVSPEKSNTGVSPG